MARSRKLPCGAAVVAILVPSVAGWHVPHGMRGFRPSRLRPFRSLDVSHDDDCVTFPPPAARRLRWAAAAEKAAGGGNNVKIDDKVEVHKYSGALFQVTKQQPRAFGVYLSGPFFCKPFACP